MPAPVVDDAQHDAVVAPARSDSQTWRAPRVARDVRQALLGDAVDRELRVGRERRQLVRELPLELEPALLGERRRERCQRARRARDARAARGAAPARSGARPRGSVRTASCASTSASRRAGGHLAGDRARAAAGRPSSLWPTSSCSSAAIRVRSASCAASARRPLSRRSVSSRSSISLKDAHERRRPRATPLGVSRGRDGADRRSASARPTARAA